MLCDDYSKNTSGIVYDVARRVDQRVIGFKILQIFNVQEKM